jgi:hypothetical protein
VVGRVGVAVLTAALVLTGCKFSETVSAPPSEPFMVVHGVLDLGDNRQFVTVERAEGGTTAGESGASVQLTHLNPGTSCANPTVGLSELPFPAPGIPMKGIYVTHNLCPLAAGDRVALRVETGDGKIVTGETRTPGMRAVRVQSGGRTTFLGQSGVTMDRSHDSLRIGMDGLAGRALQIEVIRDDAGGYVTYRFATDTVNLTIAGNLVDPFDGDGRTVFRAGARYILTVAALDTNSYDFVRSGSDPFTGRGFINHLKGGVGVFGSVAPLTSSLDVTAPQIDQREGVYQITGRLGDVLVDITWNLYRDLLTPNASGFSGFVDGTWVDGPRQTSANAVIALQPDPQFGPATFVGTIYGAVRLPDLPGQVGNSYQLTGLRATPGTPFPVVVTYRDGGFERSDTLTAVQVRSP